MSEPIPEKPLKKVKVHSLGSFWLHVFKKSFKNAREPFENFGTLCAIFAGIVAGAYLTHQVTQEWGDYMIYWSIAVPVAIWCVWFLWNLIKIPHKTYKEDLMAASSGAALVPVKDIASPNFGSLLFVVIVVTAFVCLLSVKNFQISQLKSQLTQPKQQVSISKPLPIKIIPRPEPPPTVSTQQLTVVETQKQFETFSADTGGVENVASHIARLKAEKAAKIEEENRQKDIDIKKWWNIYLPYYQHSLVVLHDVLTSESAKAGDGIAQSVGYFQSLPPDIDPKTEEIKSANIGFQKDTNMNFLVVISGLNISQHRQLKIYCSSGYLEMEAAWGKTFWRNLHIDPDFDDFKEVPIDKADDLISESIKDLIGAQLLHNKSDTKTVDKP